MLNTKQTDGFKMLKEDLNPDVQSQLKLDRSLPFYELNYIKVKGGAEAEFLEEIDSIRKLKVESYKVSYFKIFKSFAAFSKSKSRNMFIELVKWENLESFKMARSMQTQPIHYEIQESIKMRPADIQTYDLEQLIERGNAIEFGARVIRSKYKMKFREEREQFMSNIIKQEGYKFDREFVSMDEDLGVIVFGWEKDQDYINAGNKVKRSFRLLARTLWYFRLVKNRAFQVATLID